MDNDQHIEATASSGQHSCHICPYVSKRSSTLKRHLLTHSRKKPLSCLLCKTDSSCDGPTDNDQHVQATTSRGRHSCHLCPYVAKRPALLKRHLLTHRMKKPFNCMFCHRTFAQSDTFAEHMRIHNGDKPYHCLMCSFKAAHKRLLVLHWKTHAD